MSSPKPTIEVLYSCNLCGLKRIAVSVPARTDEDLIAWMNALGQHLSDDHRARSPECHPKSLSDIMIPMTGRDRVGGPSVQ